MRLPRSATVAARSALALAASALPAQGLQTAAAHDESAAQLIGVPSLRYAIVRDDPGRRHVSIAAVFRTDRALDRSRYAVVAAPTLQRGQRLPDALFGGLTAQRIGDGARHCYVAEPAQLQRRTRVGRPTWRLGLHTGDRVTGRVKRVTLARTTSDRWQRAAARRLGCASSR